MSEEKINRPHVLIRRLHVESSAPDNFEGGFVALARAIIYQAMLDMVSTKVVLRRARTEANRWFFVANRDFRDICDLAELNYDIVRSRAKEIKNNPALVGNIKYE